VSTVREALDSGYKVKVGQGQIDGHHEEAPPVPLQDGESVLVEAVVQEQYELGGTRSETEVSRPRSLDRIETHGTASIVTSRLTCS
jgi:hypothetical protein